MKQISLLILSYLLSFPLYAQMERTRAVNSLPDTEVFLTSTLVGTQTVQLTPSGELQSIISHSFGPIRSGWVDLFGLDNNAAVHLALDYGVSDDLTIGIGRTSVRDVFDFRYKWVPLRQNAGTNQTFSLGLYGNVAVETLKERRFDYTFGERLSFYHSLILARQFYNRISFQLSPSIIHFNTLLANDRAPLSHTLFSTIVSGRLKLNERQSLSFEYVGYTHNTDAPNHLALSYEIETGGHVFQLFLQSGYHFSEQYLIAYTEDDFLKGDIRMGFAIHRVFQLKGK